MKHNQERGGYPSASSMERLLLCPGSHRASIGIKEVESEAAKSGTRIHALIAKEITQKDCTPDEVIMAGKCELITNKIVMDIFHTDLSKLSNVYREPRLWAYENSENEMPIYSGKADLVVTLTKHDWKEIKAKALIIDYKTGRGITEVSSKNMQLRTLAVLLNETNATNASTLGWRPYSIPNYTYSRKIGVAIVQPMISDEPVITWYEEDELIQAKKQIVEIVEKSWAESAPRIPGETQCKYCPAKSRCPEANAVITTVATMSGALEEMPEEHLALSLDKCDIAESVIDSIRSEARRRIETGQTVRGWFMKPGAIKQVITKPEEVFARFYAIGGNNEQFMNAVSIAKGKFQEAVKEATGQTGKELSSVVERLLTGCTESKQNNPSLTKEKTNDNG